MNTPEPNSISFNIHEPETVEVMRIGRNGIWANPNVPVNDTAKAVLESLDVYIKKLVAESQTQTKG